MDERCQALREYCLSLLVFGSDNEDNTISQTYCRYFAHRVFMPLFIISTKSLLLARMFYSSFALVKVKLKRTLPAHFSWFLMLLAVNFWSVFSERCSSAPDGSGYPAKGEIWWVGEE